MLAVITLASFLVWAFWNVAVPIALAYLGGRLMASDMPEASQAQGESAQSRTWNPRTTSQEGIARARAYGKNLHHGNIAAKWTDVVDNREVLYMIVDHGDGPTKGVADLTTDVYLNEQPAKNFTSIAIQQRLGTMNQTVMTGFEKPKLEYKVNTELLYGETTLFTTPNDFFDDIEYTIMFPNGLYFRHKSGGFGTMYHNLKVRLREIGGAWSTIYNDNIVALTSHAMCYKFTVSDYAAITKGTQYELEFSTLTSTTVDRVTNKVYIRSVREVVETAFTRPGRALIGIRAISTSALSGNIDVKVIREDRIINVYNGTSWSLEYSNNRAWVDWDIATLPCIEGDNNGGGPYTIKRYDGIDPQYLDLEFFYNWALFCDEEILDGNGGTEHRIDCNTIVDEFTDIYTLVRKIGAIGRATIYWKDQILTGWIDDAVADSDIKDLVTMDTVMHKSWKNFWTITEELAGVVEVFYKDENLGYERTSADFSVADAGSFRDIITLEGIGITSRGQAVHYAHYLLERNRLILNKNSFRTHKEGFRYKLGDMIRLQSKPSNWGKGFRVRSSTADTITVNRDASAEVSVGDVLYIRTYDTALEIVVIDTYEVDSVVDRVITVERNWDVTPIKGNAVAIGSANSIKLRRIIKIKPTVDNFFDVEVETYTVDLFDADDLDPDNPNVNYVWPGALPQLSDIVSRADVQDMISQAIPEQPDIEIPILSNITWNNDDPDGDSISWEATDGTDDITLTLKGEVYLITPDNTNKEFIYWDPNFSTIFKTTDLITTATAAGNWLMARNIDGIAYPVHGMVAANIGILLAGFLRVTTADIVNLAVTTAKINDLAVAEGKIGALAVTTAKIDNLSVENAKIANLSVGTSKLQANASHVDETYHNNSQALTVGSWVTVATDNITSGGRIVLSSCSCRAHSHTGAVYYATNGDIRIQCQGSTIAQNTWSCASGEEAYPIVMGVNQPGAGLKTYTIQIRMVNGPGTTDYALDIDMNLLEHKGK